MATHSGILAWRIPKDRGAWWAMVHRVTKSQTQVKRLTTHGHIPSNTKGCIVNVSANTAAPPGPMHHPEARGMYHHLALWFMLPSSASPIRI